MKLTTENTPETDDQPTINAINDNGYQVPCVDIEFARKLERERDEAREALSSIHRWIERNHADGFIDSLTYLQNLERVTDCWYDRIDKIERERDEAREDLEFRRGLYAIQTQRLERIERERDEARLDGKIYYNRMRQLGWELYEAREALREIAEASGFDNIGDWARNKARKALEGAK